MTTTNVPDVETFAAAHLLMLAAVDDGRGTSRHPDAATTRGDLTLVRDTRVFTVRWVARGQHIVLDDAVRFRWVEHGIEQVALADVRAAVRAPRTQVA